MLLRRALASVLAAACAGLTGIPLAYAGPPTSSSGMWDASDSAPGSFVERDLQLPVGPEPDGSPVMLDVSIDRPDPATSRPGPWPVVLLAHGFGGSKTDLIERARDLAGRGYVAVSYSARGFGQSTGRGHLNDPLFEVADARVIVDRVATEPGVLLDGPGDPRLAVVGASYGGALAVMLGATDPRVDSVVGTVTWNDLADAFFPQFATAATESAGPSDAATVEPTPTVGVFKQLWAARFFGSGAAAGGGGGVGRGANPLCGRMDPTVCRLFLAAAETGSPSPELLSLLHAHSPKPLLSGLRASTLLVQGMRDTLFGLEQADATARAIAGQVPRLAVRWIDGGHDGASSTADADEQALRDWLADTLRSPAGATQTGTRPNEFIYAATIPRRQSIAPLLGVPSYPGAVSWTSAPWNAPKPAVVATPPGGQPESISAMPGIGALSSVSASAAYQLAALPGQSAAFDTTPFAQRRTIVGAPRVTLTVTSTGADVVLFLSLWQVTGEAASLPRRLVAPIHVVTTPGQATTVEVALPPATWTVEAGSSLRLLVTSTDSLYAGPRAARVDRVAVAGDLRLPDIAGVVLSRESDTDTESLGVAAALGAVLLAAAGATLVSWRRRRRRPSRPDLADVPLVVEHLVKTYADGHRAVDDVSWRAERGQVVGLLGPNGAGKTTTLRMALGLIHPDSGLAYVGGDPVLPGAAVLGRVGALVEGPGFLPHLTGRANLQAYWAATGRPPQEAHVDEVLEVAALGDAIERPVRSYSHGMKQRLGIAQAMLGLPELLILDEPTNGLDPPQIAAMRPILSRYAAAGRTVVVSSHLLAEVEQTCTHVVVMHAGRVVTTGTVAELVDSSDTTVVHLDPATEPAAAAAVAERLRAVTGVRSVEVVEDEGDVRLVVTAGMPRPDVVRALTAVGADVVGVSSRKHLEEVFLGVIAAAQHAGASTNGARGGGDGSAAEPVSVTEQLRKVRAR